MVSFKQFFKFNRYIWGLRRFKDKILDSCDSIGHFKDIIKLSFYIEERQNIWGQDRAGYQRGRIGQDTSGAG